MKKFIKLTIHSKWKKTVMTSFATITFAYACFAQDVIVTKDSKKIEVSVIEKNALYIRYKLYDYQLGHTYLIPKSNIVSIQYENGTVETYESAASSQRTAMTTSQEAEGSNSFASKAPPANVMTEMRSGYPEIYKQYRSASRLKSTGSIFTYAGLGIAVSGFLGHATEGPEDGENAIIKSLTMGVAGCIMVGAGIPVMIVGGKKKKSTLNEFYQQYYSLQQPAPYFQFNVQPKGIGIAYVF